MQSLNCIDKVAVADLSLSRQTCARNGLAICEYFKGKTKQMMANVAAVSIMFDEASDIQMHKHLNIFVNVRLCRFTVCTIVFNASHAAYLYMYSYNVLRSCYATRVK
jgi:hypothetical protein